MHSARLGGPGRPRRRRERGLRMPTVLSRMGVVPGARKDSRYLSGEPAEAPGRRRNSDLVLEPDRTTIFHYWTGYDVFFPNKYIQDLNGRLRDKRKKSLSRIASMGPQTPALCVPSSKSRSLKFNGHIGVGQWAWSNPLQHHSEYTEK